VITELKQMGLNLSFESITLSNKLLLPENHHLEIGQPASARLVKGVQSTCNVENFDFFKN